jgi:lysozyme
MPEPLNVVIDISHHDGNVNLAKAKKDGILGVIQKATQGQTFKDPTYERNRQKAKDAGLLWGAYHFGTGSDGLKQAQHFLDVVGNDPGTLLALDFEPNPTGPSMDLEEARALVTHINEETGRFPGFYSGHYIKQLLGTSTDPILAECWFWLAQYGPTQWFQGTGRLGRCGSIQTVLSGPSRTRLRESGGVIETNSTVAKRN